ncbi:MAG: hypothetical protein ABIG66_02780 [Candidatus Kerfeldbacteria bacterium]
MIFGVLAIIASFAICEPAATARPASRCQDTGYDVQYCLGLQFIGDMQVGVIARRYTWDPDMDNNTFLLKPSLGLGYGTEKMLFRASGVFVHHSRGPKRYMAAGGGFKLGWHAYVGMMDDVWLYNDLQVEFLVAEFPELSIQDIFYLGCDSWPMVNIGWGVELKLVKFNWDFEEDHPAVRAFGIGPVMQLELRFLTRDRFANTTYLRISGLRGQEAGAEGPEEVMVVTGVLGTEFQF